MNDVIENKVHQLKELSKKQKKLSEIKQDIADILGNTNIEEKKKIAEKMSAMPYENMNQARNLQFIVPHVVKELYDHEGPKGEFIIPKKEPVITPTPIEEPVIEAVEPITEKTEPTIENKKKEKTREIVEPVVEEKVKAEPVVIEEEKKQEEPVVEKKKDTEEKPKISPISKIAKDMHVVPGYEIEKIKQVTEEEQETKKEKTEEPIIEENQPEIVEEEKTEVMEIPVKKKKVSSRKKIRQRLKPKTKEEKLRREEEKLKEIRQKRQTLEQQVKDAEAEENEQN